MNTCIILLAYRFVLFYGLSWCVPLNMLLSTSNAFTPRAVKENAWRSRLKTSVLTERHCSKTLKFIGRGHFRHAFHITKKSMQHFFIREFVD